MIKLGEYFLLIVFTFLVIQNSASPTKTNLYRRYDGMCKVKEIIQVIKDEDFELECAIRCSFANGNPCFGYRYENETCRHVKKLSYKPGHSQEGFIAKGR